MQTVCDLQDAIARMVDSDTDFATFEAACTKLRRQHWNYDNAARATVCHAALTDMSPQAALELLSGVIVAFAMSQYHREGIPFVRDAILELLEGLFDLGIEIAARRSS